MNEVHSLRYLVGRRYLYMRDVSGRIDGILLALVRRQRKERDPKPIEHRRVRSERRVKRRRSGVREVCERKHHSRIPCPETLHVDRTTGVALDGAEGDLQCRAGNHGGLPGWNGRSLSFPGWSPKGE